ncbi:hypothetical protein OH76DRAFT_1420507 [Lentinus brumalis]|uniref:Uncharacterized protein n=1 Tax=Lentinus brumalis TaxID=2498619 RepID=A0A371D093_9APHY|nr:hypothetical protein OH76DRAFT_1420507 [Polyporus brumalis]
MFARRAPHRYGHGAGFGAGRINHVKLNNPKPFPAPPLTPFDIHGVRHAQLQEKNEINAPHPDVHPRTKYRPLTKKEILVRSLKKALTPPEERARARNPKPPVSKPPAKNLITQDPKLPGGLSFDDPEPAPQPEFGAEVAKRYAAELGEGELDDEDMRVLHIFEELKIQGQTRERYHENEVALESAAKSQPERERLLAMDRAHAAKCEERYLRKLAEAKEKEQRERQKEAERQERERERERKREEKRRAAEERKRQEMEEENRRRIAREQEQERLWKERVREEERQRQLRAEKERARLVAEARRVEEMRRARATQVQWEKEAKIRNEQEAFRRLSERARLMAEREEGERRAQQEEERMRQTQLLAELDALRQAAREAHEMMAQMERDDAAKVAFLQAAEYRAHLMEQELRAREQHQWAQAQAFMQQLEQAYREHAMLEQAFRDAQQRYLLEQQQRAAREGQEWAERQERDAAEAAAQEIRERAAQAAREAELDANKAAIAKQICDWYDHRWNVLKTRNDIDNQVPYSDFPIPYFPPISYVGQPIPPAPQPSELVYEQVRAFVMSPHRASMATKSAKVRIRAEIRFWHPDMFERKFLRLMQPQDKKTAMEAVYFLSRILNQIKEDVQKEEWAAQEAREDAAKAGAA